MRPLQLRCLVGCIPTIWSQHSFSIDVTQALVSNLLQTRAERGVDQSVWSMHRRREQLFQGLCPVINSLIITVILKALYSTCSKSSNNLVAVVTIALKITSLSNKAPRCSSTAQSASKTTTIMTVSGRLGAQTPRTRAIARSTSRSSSSRRRIRSLMATSSDQ